MKTNYYDKIWKKKQRDIYKVPGWTLWILLLTYIFSMIYGEYSLSALIICIFGLGLFTKAYIEES